MATGKLIGPLAVRLKALFLEVTEQHKECIVIMFDGSLNNATFCGTMVPDANDKLAEMLEREAGKLRHKSASAISSYHSF